MLVRPLDGAASPRSPLLDQYEASIAAAKADVAAGLFPDNGAWAYPVFRELVLYLERYDLPAESPPVDGARAFRPGDVRGVAVVWDHHERRAACLGRFEVTNAEDLAVLTRGYDVTRNQQRVDLTLIRDLERRAIDAIATSLRKLPPPARAELGRGSASK